MLLVLSFLMVPALSFSQKNVFIDACKDTSRWKGMLQQHIYDSRGEVEDDIILETFTPEEFFTPQGASIPGYTPTRPDIGPYFSFKDTSCITHDFKIRVESSFVDMNDWMQTIFGMDVIYPSRETIEKSAKKRKRIEVRDTIAPDTSKRKLKDYSVKTSVLGFVYHDGTLFFQREDRTYKSEPMAICGIKNIEVYWTYWGGKINRIDFWDYENGTEYHEDFSDCSNVQLFPKCDPELEPTLTTTHTIPYCPGDSLKMAVESDLLTDFHWAGPDGWKAEGDSITIPGKEAKSGTYTVWSQTDFCHPIYYKEIEVVIPDPKTDTAVYVSVCHGSSINLNGREVAESGTYIDTLQSSHGCDSVVTYYVTIKSERVVIEDTICSGETYQFGNEILKTEGIYTETFTNENGCDSVVTLHLYVQKPIIPTVIPLSLCKGDSLEYNGHTFKQAGNFRDTLTSANGCDSVVIYKIHALKTYDTTFVYRICSDSSVLLPTGEWVNYNYSTDTLLQFDTHECRMNTHIRVYAYPAISQKDTNLTLCGNHSILVSLDSTRHASYKWIPSAGVAQPDRRTTTVTVEKEALYHVAIATPYCRDTVKVGLTYDEPPVIQAITINPDGSDLKVETMHGIPPFQYRIDTLPEWHTAIDFDTIPIGAHQLIIKDQNGCENTKNFNYFIPVIPSPIVTPNGDGVNDTWEIKNLDKYQFYVIRIFDRWGKELVVYKNEYPGWDGTYHGERMPTTDYWYSISIHLNEQDITGHFTLLR